MPVLSIIIPVYNVSQYLEKCVQSCYNQNISGDNFEVILVNDGSTDNSLEVCLNLQKQFSDLKIINQKNKGLSGARNTGLKQAKGKYIWFIDSDDWIEETALKTLFKVINSHNVELFWLGHNVIFNEKTVKTFIPQSIIEPITGEKLLTNHLNQLFYIWKFIYKRTFLIENNLEFKEGVLYEDLEFTPRVLLKSKSCYTVNETLYNYLIRPGSIANIDNITNKTISDRLIIIDHIIDLEQSKNISTSSSKALQNIVLNEYLSTIKMSARGKLKLTDLAKQVLTKIKEANYYIKNRKLHFSLMLISLSVYHYFYKSAYNMASKLKNHE